MRLLAVVMLFVSGLAFAAPKQVDIPEEVKRIRKGIKRETHEKCLEWWEDWVAQNWEEVKKLDALERHCTFWHYMNECGNGMAGREMPTSAPGSGVPSFHNYPDWDEDMTVLYEDRCFKFAADPESERGTVVGGTKRVSQLLRAGEQRTHVERRIQRYRVVPAAVRLPAVVPGSRVQRHSAKQAGGK
ncbi:MAG TPA: hypothetical protein VEU33_24650 [Archangium sp.]|nr:hypothetical protein [Archangium sp.]